MRPKLLVIYLMLACGILLWPFRDRLMHTLLTRTQATLHPENRVLHVLAQQRERRVRSRFAAAVEGRLAAAWAPSPEPLRDSYVEIADALRETLPPAELRRRLWQVGFRGRWLHGKLAQVSVTGGGIAVQLGKRGQLRTGPGVTESILAAFPELQPLALVNMPTFTTTLTQGVGRVWINPTADTVSAQLVADLSGVGTNWDITDARFTGLGSYSAYNPCTFTASHPKCTGFNLTVDGPPDNQNFSVVLFWNSADLVSLEAAAGLTNVNTGLGTISMSAGPANEAAGEFDSWNNSVFINTLIITYVVCS